MWLPTLDLTVSRRGVGSRRTMLKRLGGVAAASAASLGWHDLLLARSNELRKRGKSMILLWLDGGPSQFDTFNPKPGSLNQGPAGAISTNVPGVHFADWWPQTSRIMDRLAVIRSMRTKEAEHDRAITHLRTGYPPTPALRYPTFGSVVARDREDPEFDLPAFVRIGQPRIRNRDVDAGVLGVRYSSFNLDRPNELPPHVRPRTTEEVMRRRLSLANDLDEEFVEAGGSAEAAQRRTTYDRAVRFMLSPRLSAFDLDREPSALRDAYGRSDFGQGCLLARRLVEEGVSFVEVISTGGRNDAGWDTHRDGYRDTPFLSAECDPAYSTLILDLEQRGMLEDTLVVWMGEFGRTPKIKDDGGRDHYAKGWIVSFAGGGVQGGQVIGATDKDGIDVTDRAIDVPDLFVTFCHALSIDPHEEYRTADGRPVKLVEGGKVIHELFS